MTAWNPNIPNPANVPANDAVSMQQNFAVLDQSYQVNHVPLSVATDMGKHPVVNFPVQSGDMGTGANDVALYAKNVVYPGPNTFVELFFRRQGNTNVSQLTSGNAQQGISANYWQSFLPGGLQIKFGLENLGTPVAINFVARGLTNFPTTMLGAVITAFNTGRVYNFDAPATTGFTANSSAVGAAPFFWIAIGY